jgi:hypothetical protein
MGVGGVYMVLLQNATIFLLQITWVYAYIRIQSAIKGDYYDYYE